MDGAGGPLSLQFRNQKLRAAEIAQVRDSSAALKSLPRRRSQSKFAVLQVCSVEMAFCLTCATRTATGEWRWRD